VLADNRKYIIKCLVAGVVIFVMLVVPAFLFRKNSDSSIKQHIVILIDHSDSYTKSQITSIKNDLINLKEEIEKDSNDNIGTLIDLFAIDGNAPPAIPSPSVTICIEKIGLRTQRNWNGLLEKSFETLMFEIDQIIINPNQSGQSPIFEYIHHISRWNKFKNNNVTSRSIRIYSDFLQNIRDMWPLKTNIRPEFDKIIKTNYYKRIKPDLTNIYINARYLMSKKYRAFQTDQHRKFLEEYFDDADVADLDFLIL
jgi:hypothetical protein